MVDLNEYIAMHQDDFPELVNFMGFDADQEEDQDEVMEHDDANKLYQEHLSYEEMVMGVKEGRFFQGRLNVSRLVQTEASVKV